MSETNAAATLSIDINTESAEFKLGELHAKYEALKASLANQNLASGLGQVASDADKAKSAIGGLGGASKELSALRQENNALTTQIKSLKGQVDSLSDGFKNFSANAKAGSASFSAGVSDMSRKVRVGLKDLGAEYASITNTLANEAKKLASNGFDVGSQVKGFRLLGQSASDSTKQLGDLVGKLREAKWLLEQTNAPTTVDRKYGAGTASLVARLPELETNLRMREMLEKVEKEDPVARRKLAQRNDKITSTQDTSARQYVNEMTLQNRARQEEEARVAENLAERNKAILETQRRSTTTLIAEMTAENKRRQAAMQSVLNASDKYLTSNPTGQARTNLAAAYRIERGRDTSRMAPEAVAAAQQLGGVQAAQSALDALTATQNSSKKAAADLSGSHGVVRKSAADMAAATRQSAESQRHWNTLANDGHAAARGLSGALGGLWMTYGSIAPLLAAAAAAGALKQVFTVGKELETQFTMISAISDGVAVDINKFNSAVAGTMSTPTEAAKGLRVLAQAGLSVGESLTALPAVLKLAAVGETDMANAALSATSIMHSFGLSVNDMGHIGDVFAKAAAISATSVTEMMNAMKQASAVSDMFGVKMEETAAALATLANRGIEGSAAGTALRNMVKEMATPATEKAAFAMKQLGIEVYKADGSAKSFTENLEQLAQATSTMSAKGKAKFLEDMFNERGVKAANILLSDLDKLKASLKDIETSSKGLGFMTEANIKVSLSTDGMLKTLKGDFERVLGSAFKDVEPQIKQIIGSISELVNSKEFGEMISSMAKGVVSLTQALIEHADTLKMVAAAYLVFKGGNLAGSALTILASEWGKVTAGVQALTRVDMAATAARHVAAASAITTAVTTTAAATTAGASVVASQGGLAATALSNIRFMAIGMVNPVTLAAGALAILGAAAYSAYQSMSGVSDEQQKIIEKAQAYVDANDLLEKEVNKGATALEKEGEVLREQIKLMQEGKTAADAFAQANRNVTLSAAQANADAIRAQVNKVRSQVGSNPVDADDFDEATRVRGAVQTRQQAVNALGPLEKKLAEAEAQVAKIEATSARAEVFAADNGATKTLLGRINGAKQLNKELLDIAQNGAEAEKALTGKGLSEAARSRLQEQVTLKNKTANLLPLPIGAKDEQNNNTQVATESDIKAQRAEIDAAKHGFEGYKKPDRQGLKDGRSILTDDLASALKREQFVLGKELLEIEIDAAQQSITTAEATRQKNIATEASIDIERMLIDVAYELAKATGDKVTMSKFANDLLENEEKKSKQLQQTLLDLEKTRTANNNSISDTSRSTSRYIQDLEFERLAAGKTALEVANLRIERERSRATEDVQQQLDRKQITPEVGATLLEAERQKKEAQRSDAAYQTSFVGGWQRAFDEYSRAATNSAETASSIFKSMSKSMEDALTQFLTTGKLGFKSFASTVLAEAARVMSSKAVSGLLGMVGNFALGMISGGGNGAAPNAWTGGSGPGATGISSEGQIWNAKGNVFSGSNSLHQYVNTVQSSPKTFAFDTLHGFAKGGVFAEAGPEAVMPLARDGAGRLGVRAQGGAEQGGVMINITVNQADGSSKQESSGGDTKAAWGEFAGRVRTMILEEIDTQKRPGGRLYA